MAPKKYQYKKKFFRKWRKKGRISRPKIGKPSKGLTQSRYFFKRRFTNLITLSTASGASTGGFYQQVPADMGSPGCTVRWQIRLSDLPDNSEFTSGLFSSYRINAMKVRMIPQYTQTTYATNAPVQVICYTMPYNYNLDLPTPSVNPLTESICLQTQACKTETLVDDGNGKSFYSKCKILNTILSGLTADTQQLVKPRWLPCDHTDIYHYGLIQRFQPNWTAWPTTSVQVKLIVTAYLEFRGVV